jgi:hypothetical protein
MDPLFLAILAGAVLAFGLAAILVLRSRGGERVRGDMIEQQRRASGAGPPAHPRRLDGVDRNAAAAHVADPLTVPEIRAAIEDGRKLEAIKLVRERFGLGLREAKELVERHS